MILSSFFLFNACNKDAELSDQEISSRSEERNMQVEVQESYNAFSQKRQNVQKCDECYTNPLYYDIELESGKIVEYEGDLAITFKVKDSPFQYTTLNRNQILVKKDVEGNYSVSNLIYLADSTFYALKKYKPLSINFTGVILEINQDGKLLKAFSSQFGQIVKMMDENEILRNVNSLHDLKFRNDGEIEQIDEPWWKKLWGWIKGVTCPSADGKSHFWEDVGDWFGEIFEKKGIASTNSTNFSDIFSHKHRGTSSWYSNNNNDGNGGYGGGNLNSPYYSICEDLDQYWNSLKSTTKFDYFDAISKVVSEFNVGLCDEQLYSNTIGCPINYYEILCNARYINCLPPAETLEIDEEDIEDCIRDVLTPYRNTNLPKECLTAVKAFNSKYGLSINPFLLNVVMCGFEDLCDQPEAFNCEANKAAFFLRPDIQQIIADNAVIDPCNPDLTSKDILNDYANNNCQEGICTKPLDDIYSDIGEEQDIIITELSFLACPTAKCMYKKIKKLQNDYFCNLIKGMDASLTKIVFLTSRDLPAPEDGGVDIIGKNRFELIIDKLHCNSNDYLGIAQTLIHEFNHLDFKFKFENVIDRETYKIQWAEYVNKKYGIQYSEHHVMVLEYMKKQAETLRNLDGNRYPYDYYSYLVWTGGLEFWWEGIFSNTQVQVWKNKYEIVKNNPSKINCDE